MSAGDYFYDEDYDREDEEYHTFTNFSLLQTTDQAIRVQIKNQKYWIPKKAVANMDEEALSVWNWFDMKPIPQPINKQVEGDFEGF